MINFLKRHVGVVIIIVAFIVSAMCYIFVPMFVKKELRVVYVPISTIQINETTKIKEEMITEIEMMNEYLPSSIITNKDNIIGKYVKNDCTIAPNQFFYKELLVDEEIAMGKIFRELRENEIAYNLTVDPQWIQNDNIHLNQLINVYVHFTNEIEKGGQNYIFGQLAENIRVIGISEDSTIITLALSEEDVALFNLAYLIEDSSITFVPTTYFNSNGALEYNTQYYDINATKNYIKEHSTILNIPVIEDEIEITNSQEENLFNAE